MSTLARARRAPLALGAVCLTSAVSAARVDAQVVRVTVSEAESGGRAAGVVVSLTDSAGRRRVSALTEDDGVAHLRPPATGAYGVRAERVGAGAWTSAAPRVLDPASPDTVRVAAVLGARTARLGAMVVQTKRTCDALGAADGAAASIWQAASAALAANALTEADRRVALRVRTFHRELTRDGRVRTEETRSERVAPGRPFETRPPAELATRGYVRPERPGALYFGPDAAVLLSGEFADTHCVRAVRGKGADAGLVGIAFEPLPGRPVPDIAGTLWLDGETSALRHVTFEYVGVPSPEPGYEVPREATATGRVEFAPGRGGAWIVRRWTLRLPRLTRRAVEARLASRGMSGSEVYGVAGFTEEGGEAVPAAEGRTPTVASLRVTAFDSVAGRPLAGVTVVLEDGTRAVTDGGGVAAVTLRRHGTLAARYEHQRLLAAGVGVAGDSVRTAADGRATLDVAVPSPARLRVLACGADAATDVDQGVVAGTLTDSVTGAPAADAPVRLLATGFGIARAGTRTTVRKRGTELETRTDARGRFLFCRVPAAHTFVLVRGTKQEGEARRALELPPHGVLLVAW